MIGHARTSGVILSYLSPTWTRSPSCSRSPIGTRSPGLGQGLHLGVIQAFLVLVGVLHYVGTLV